MTGWFGRALAKLRPTQAQAEILSRLKFPCC